MADAITMLNDRAIEALSAAPNDGVEKKLCFHCQLPVPHLSNYHLVINDERREMCCPGCVAAASMIISANLTEYYQYRDICAVDEPDETASVDTADVHEFEAYAKAEYTQQYCRIVGQRIEADLIISGIRCAACVWLLEKYLSDMIGMIDVRVNLGDHRTYLTFDPVLTDVVKIFVAVNKLGYKAYPYVASIEESLYQQQKTTLLKALGVSAIGVMQVMMFTIALYAGAFEGISDAFTSLLRWSSLVVTTPIVFYSARSFFSNAWRDIQKFKMGMDLPVSLAIGGAYCASVINTLWLNGEVYFESVSMFTFFLLLSRFIELTARQQLALSTNALVSVFPTYALRYEHDQLTSVLLSELKIGDKVSVINGATIPADGIIVSGKTQIDESAFSGESLPVIRGLDEQVFAGCINIQNPFDMTVNSLPQQSLLSNMVRLTDRSAADKPMIAQLADKVAGYFVLLVLSVAVLSSVYWYLNDPEQVISVTLAVLVVSCPCALSLATPVALSVGNKRLMHLGLMPTTGRLLRGLGQIDTVLFDKTGTLTTGELELNSIHGLNNFCENQISQIAMALEQGVDHPLAKAVVNHGIEMGLKENSPFTVDEQSIVQGEGVTGIIGGKHYYFGNEPFIVDTTGITLPEKPINIPNAIFVLLVAEKQPIGWFVFTDRLRQDAMQTINTIKKTGKSIHMISGDSQQACKSIAEHLSIGDIKATMKPQDKIVYVKKLIGLGHKVLMVGDGINDAAALKLAHVSIAMSNASQFVQTKADGVMLGEKLQIINAALVLAKRTQSITRQNIFWALCYNICALPLAFMGYIPPWLAALGMSCSSLIVLMNSFRLNHARVNQ